MPIRHAACSRLRRSGRRFGIFVEFILFYNSDVKNCTPEFYEALFAYDWPGNVRELEHVIESAVVMLNNGDVLGVSDLPANVITAYQSAKQSLENRIKENAETADYFKVRKVEWES